MNIHYSMKNIYISIGAQCTTATLFERLGVKKESLPFDWMISTPEFVYIILKLLLIDTIEIEEIVDNHFFICNKWASVYNSTFEHYITNDTGHILVNSKYNVCFPHTTGPRSTNAGSSAATGDSLPTLRCAVCAAPATSHCRRCAAPYCGAEHQKAHCHTAIDREAYIRRIKRLKELILDKNNYIYFVYVTVSSPNIGNYTLDGIEPIQDLYFFINEINDIIKSITNNYKILVFDTNNSNRITSTDIDHLEYYDISQSYHWLGLFEDLLPLGRKLLTTV